MVAGSNKKLRSWFKNYKFLTRILWKVGSHLPAPVCIINQLKSHWTVTCRPWLQKVYVWQTVWPLIRCLVLRRLIWVYTVFSGLPVPIFRVITVTKNLHYSPQHDSGGVLWYTLRCPSVRPHIRTSFPDNSSYSFRRIMLKLGGQTDHEVLFRGYSTPHFDRIITLLTIFRDVYFVSG